MKKTEENKNEIVISQILNVVNVPEYISTLTKMNLQDDRVGMNELVRYTVKKVLKLKGRFNHYQIALEIIK